MVVHSDLTAFTLEKTLIEELAYQHFVRSGCANGNDVQHWLDAEKELSEDAFERYEVLIESCDDGLHRILSGSHLL